MRRSLVAILALAIACIYYARQQCWWLAGLCGCLASATPSRHARCSPASGKWLVPRGTSEWNAEVSGFAKAWRTLPRSITHIVVIHDTPKDLDSTAACIERAIATHRDAGRACAVPRRLALVRDSEAVAAARVRSARVRTVASSVVSRPQ